MLQPKSSFQTNLLLVLAAILYIWQHWAWAWHWELISLIFIAHHIMNYITMQWQRRRKWQSKHIDFSVKMIHIGRKLKNEVMKFIFGKTKFSAWRLLFAANAARARFSKIPKAFRARKAICETANRLFWKADLLTCFQGNKKKNDCEVWRLKSSWDAKRNGPQDTLSSEEGRGP